MSKLGEYTKSYYQFLVGGAQDSDDINVVDVLGVPAQSLYISNDTAGIPIFVQFDTKNDGKFGNPLRIAGGNTYLIVPGTGIRVYRTRAYSSAINGYYTIQFFPGEIEHKVAEKRETPATAFEPIDL
jgi:hypothetical protein